MLSDMVERSGGKLATDIRDPDAEGGALARQIASDFGIRPMVAGLFDTGTF